MTARWIWPGILVLALLSARPAAAQEEEGPIVFGQEQPRQFLHLDNLQAALDFNYRGEQDRISSPNSAPTTFRENRFDEDVDASANAYIIHPNLVELTMSGSFGLLQDYAKDTGNGENQFGTLDQYDLEATILRKENTPLTLYSRRTEQLINAEFTPSLDNIITTTGGSMIFRSPTLPSRVEAYHSDETSSSLDPTNDYTLAQNTFTWHTDAHPSAQQTLSLDYTFNNVRQTNPFGSETFNTNAATVTDSIAFGAQSRSSLNSTITWFDESGQFPYDQIHWDELLSLRHSDWFETHYEYTLDQQRILDEEDTQNRGQVGFTHWLYKSLITTVNGGVSDLDRSDGSGSFQTYANANFDYHKIVPYGTLSSTMSYAINNTRNTAQSQTTEILGGTQMFPLTGVIIIPVRHVVPGSVRLTNPLGVPYHDGTDFIVNTFPDHIEIDRSFTGLIGPSDPVDVDYATEAQPGNTVVTNTFGYSLRYDIQQGRLSGLSLYGNFGSQTQQIDTEDPAYFEPDMFTDTLAGVEYRFLDFDLIAEQEYYNSTIVPFDATRFTARYTHRLSMDAVFVADANYDILHYNEDNERINLLVLAGQLQYKLNQDWSAYATLLYRDEADNLSGPMNGLEESLELRWTRAQTSAYAQIRDAQLTATGQRSNFLLLEFGFRREF